MLPRHQGRPCPQLGPVRPPPPPRPGQANTAGRARPPLLGASGQGRRPAPACLLDGGRCGDAAAPQVVVQDGRLPPPAAEGCCLLRCPTLGAQKAGVQVVMSGGFSNALRSPPLTACRYSKMSEEEIKKDRYAKFRKLGQYEEFTVIGGAWREARAEREAARKAVRFRRHRRPAARARGSLPCCAVCAVPRCRHAPPPPPFACCHSGCFPAHRKEPHWPSFSASSLTCHLNNVMI